MAQIFPEPLLGRVNRMVFPSGDQLCQYEKGFSVTARGVPPLKGTTYTRDSGFPGMLHVIASNFPSGERPWLPLQFVAAPISKAVGVPPVAGTFIILPS